VAGRDWADPLDASFAQRVGGRWNPPDSWPTLYLSCDLDTARAQIIRLLESTPVTPDDLTDDAYDLLAVALPAANVVDIVTDVGVAGAGLPATYPCDATGQLIPHATCQRIAKRAHESGADGVEARSALVTVAPSATRELAWWPRRQPALQVGDRVPYGQWRVPASSPKLHTVASGPIT
jgi:RES domain-containing protein